MRVLSQGEIDNLLSSLLEDVSVLPNAQEVINKAEKHAAQFMIHDNFEPPEDAASQTTEDVPMGIAAFKAKLEAAKAAREQAQSAGST